MRARLDNGGNYPRPLLVTPQGIACDYKGAAQPMLGLVYRTTAQNLAGTSTDANSITIMTLPPIWCDGKTELLVEACVPYVTMNYSVQLAVQMDTVSIDSAILSNASGNGYEHFLDVAQFITPPAGLHIFRANAWAPGGGTASAPAAGAPYTAWLMVTPA